MNRRHLLGAAATAGMALFVPRGGRSLAAETATAGADSKMKGGPGLPPGQHSMKPLPFDPRKLLGLSERLLVSHHDNNYGGALKNLNKVEEELVRVTRETPGFIVAGLKERELTFTNSVILHELYFANLGGTGKPDGPIQKALSDAPGGFGRWEEIFRATGMSLAGGSGWAMLDFNFHTGDLRTYWAGNHTQALAFGQPLLVMDMYEHAYQIDYGAAAAKYVDAFFQNINWEEANRRLERARRAMAVFNG